MAKKQPTYDPNVVEVKSKFECEFRRFSVERSATTHFQDFHSLVKESHHLPADMPFTVSYTDPRTSDLLPITNDDNLLRAFNTAMPLIRLHIYRKQDDMLEDMHNRAKRGGKKGSAPQRASNLISAPQDFRVVSSIVDADLLPDTVRRVKLLKHSSERPLGFYIRDGTSVRVTPHGLEKVPGIFISRLVPGGLAEGTGLLAVNDEILEVNGIEVYGKSLDQVTDMMVANSQNLIITVKPACPPPPTPRSQTAPAKKKLGGSMTVVPSQPKSTTAMTKSYSDLPTVSSTPTTQSKHASFVQSNGPSSGHPKMSNEELLTKRYSVPTVLDS